MTNNLLPYAQLAEDPTSEIYISWIDTDTSRSDHDQSFEYRKKGTDDDWEEIEADKTEYPLGDGEYIHEAHLTSLDSDTEYEGTIICEDGFKSVEFYTLPSRLWRRDLVIANQSDIHILSSVSMDDSSEMDDIAAHDPDIYLFTGDLVHRADEMDSDRAPGWIEWFEDYYPRLNDSQLVPMIMSVGNHEVGEINTNELENPEAQDPEHGYYQKIFSNVPDLQAEGKNFGSVKIGNYFQFLIIDSMSATPIEQREWIDNTNPLSDNVLATLPSTHQPFTPGGQRSSDDETRRDYLRDELVRPLAKNPTVKFAVSGHIHLEKRSVPWTVVDEEPSGSDYIELKDGQEGYMVEAESEEEGITEFGDGYRNLRDSWSQWYLEYAMDDGMSNAQYEIIKVDKDNVEVMAKRFNSSREDKIEKKSFPMRTNTNQLGFIGG